MLSYPECGRTGAWGAPSTSLPQAIPPTMGRNPPGLHRVRQSNHSSQIKAPPKVVPVFSSWSTHWPGTPKHQHAWGRRASQDGATHPTSALQVWQHRNCKISQPGACLLTCSGQPFWCQHEKPCAQPKSTTEIPILQPDVPPNTRSAWKGESRAAMSRVSPPHKSSLSPPQLASQEDMSLGSLLRRAGHLRDMLPMSSRDYTLMSHPCPRWGLTGGGRTAPSSPAHTTTERWLQTRSHHQKPQLPAWRVEPNPTYPTATPQLTWLHLARQMPSGLHQL